MKLKDWLGQEYGVGDRVVYAAMSGRSVTMILGTVAAIYRVYYSRDYEWVHLADGEEPPYRQVWNKEANDYLDTSERIETELRVQVQPLSSSRWKHHSSSRTRYVDSRSGKGIDPFRGNKHIIEGYWTHNETGEVVPDSSAERDERFAKVYRYPYTDKPFNWTHTQYQFKPYVKKITEDGPKPVTLMITENIIKWNGEINGDD